MQEDFNIDKDLTAYLNKGQHKASTVFEDRPENRSKYDDFVRPFGQDINEARAERQTSLDKIGNGLFGRLPIKVASEVGKMVGYIAGAADWATTGFDTNSIDKMTDNSIVNFFTEQEHNLKELFPIYTPKYVKEGGFWDHATSLSFYMDEGVDGLGFLLSAMGPGLGMKAANVGVKAAKLAGLGKKAAGTIDLVGATAINTVFEAGSEAKGVYDSVMNQMQSRIMFGDITVEEARGKAAEAARNTFIGNGLVLLGPNLIQQSMFFGKFNTTKNAMKRTVDDAGKLLKTPLTLSNKEIAGNIAKQFGIGIASEGLWEEGSQKAIEDYNVKKALSQTDSGVLEGFFQEYLNMIGTTEGQTSMFLGAIMGSIGGGIGAYRESKQENSQVKRLHDLFDKHITDYTTNIENARETLNTFHQLNEDGSVKLDASGLPMYDLEKVEKVGREVFKRTQRAAIMDAAVAMGDTEVYEITKAEEFFDFSLPFIQTEGGLEVLSKQIDAMEQAEIERYKAIHGTSSGLDLSEMKIELKRMAQRMKDNYEHVDNYEAGFIDLKYKHEKNTPRGKAERAFGRQFLDNRKLHQLKESVMPEFYKERIQKLNQALGTIDSNIRPQEIARVVQEIKSYENLYEEAKHNYAALTNKDALQEKFERDFERLYTEEGEAKINEVTKPKEEVAPTNTEVSPTTTNTPTQPTTGGGTITPTPTPGLTVNDGVKAIITKATKATSVLELDEIEEAAKKGNYLTPELQAAIDAKKKELDEVKDDITEYDEVSLNSPSTNKNYKISTEQQVIEDGDLFTGVKDGRAVPIYKLIGDTAEIVDVVSGDSSNPTVADVAMYMDRMGITDDVLLEIAKVAKFNIERRGDVQVYKVSEIESKPELPEVDDTTIINGPPITNEPTPNHNEYGDKPGAETFLKTAAPTLESQLALPDNDPYKNYSIIRYLKFMGKHTRFINPANYELRVITKEDGDLFKYLHTKRQWDWLSTKEGKGKEGVYVALVDKTTKEFVLSDAEGNITGTSKEYSTTTWADKQMDGLVFSNLLDKNEYTAKEVEGQLAVSAKNFARKHGIPYDPSFKVGDNSKLDQAIKKEIQEKDEFRKEILSGEVGYLSIDHTTMGVIQPDGRGGHNIVGRVVENLEEATFVVPEAGENGKTLVFKGKTYDSTYDSTYELLLGELYAVVNGKPIRLEKRRLTEEEVKLVISKIKKLPYQHGNEKAKAESEAALELLNNVVYWKRETEDSPRTWSTLYDNKGTIVYGIDKSIKISDIGKKGKEAETENFKNYLSSRFRQVNKDLISDPAATIINAKGKEVNYRDWLFNKSNAFTTNLKPIGETQSLNPYIVYSTENYAARQAVNSSNDRVSKENVLDYIDRLNSNGFLADYEGKRLFSLTNGRWGIIVNVGGVQVPFYQSTSGTEGKTTGEWYPFFGDRGAWLIKGHVSQSIAGYNIKALQDVQKFLNNNISDADAIAMSMSNEIKENISDLRKLPESKLKGNPSLSINKKETARRLAEVLGYDINEANAINSEEELFKYASKQVLDKLSTASTERDNTVEEAFTDNTETPEATEEETPTETSIEDIIARAAKYGQSTEENTEIDPEDPFSRKIKDKLAPYKKQDLEKELEWFKSKFGGDAHYKLVKDLIDGGSFGQFYNGIVYLYENAEEGTLYHEAFHKVSMQYLSPRQRQNLYNELRAKEGEIETHKGVIKKFSELTDLESEEILAEDFREYMISGQSKITNRPVANSLFARLWRMIKSLIFGPSINEVYERLSKGPAYSMRDKVSVGIGVKLNKLGKLNSTDTTEAMESMTGYFFNKILSPKLGGMTMAKFLNSPNREALILQSYAFTKSKLEEHAANLGGKLKNTTDKEEITRIVKAFNTVDYIIQNWELAKQEHRKFIKSRGLAIADKFELEDVELDEIADESTDSETIDLNDEEYVTMSNNNKDGDAYKASHEFNPLEQLDTDVKFLITTLPQLEYDKNNKPVPVLTDMGTPRLVEFGTLYNFLLNELAGLKSREEIWSKLGELSQEDPSIAILKQRLGDPSNLLQMDNYKVSLWEKFRVNMALSYTENTISVIYEDGNIVSISANQQKKRNKIKDIWNTNLLEKAISVNGVLTIDSSVLTTPILQVSDRIDFLEKLGITFEGYTREELMTLPEFTESDIVTHIRNSVKKLVEAKVNVNNLFSEEVDEGSSLNNLLDLYLKRAGKNIELSSTSADNKTIYSMSRPHYVNTVVDALNSSATKDEFFEKLSDLDNAWVESSQWIHNQFDEKGNRKKFKDGSNLEHEVEFNLFNASGLKQDGDIGTPTSKLDASDKSVDEINTLLIDGRSSIPRTADKSTENTGGPNKYVLIGKTGTEAHNLAVPTEWIIKDKKRADARIQEIFTAHLISDLKLIKLGYDEVGNDISIYSDAKKDKDGNIISNSEPYKNFRVFDKIFTKKTKDKFISKYSTKEVDKLTKAESELMMKELTDYLYGNKDVKGKEVGLIAASKNYYKSNYAIGHEVYDRKDGKGRTIRKEHSTNPSNPIVLAVSGLSTKLTHDKDGKYLGNYEQLMESFAINHFVETIEWNKVMLGDPALYKDPFKRYSAFVGTKKFASTGLITNWINDSKYANVVEHPDGTSIYSQRDEELGEYLETDNMKVIISKDVKVRSVYYDTYKKFLTEKYEKERDLSVEEAEQLAEKVLKPYTEDDMTEADAQGLMDLVAYKRFKVRTGEWLWDKEEAQYQYEQAWYKKNILKKDLTPAQEVAYAKGDPGYPLVPLKTQYAGPQVSDSRINPLTFHKYSLAPLVPRLVAGTNNEALVKTMRENKVGYLVFESGVKVGGKRGKDGYHSFYTPDGNFNTDITEDKLQTIKQEFLGIQVDIAPKVKEKVIFGTQFRKLVWSNAFNGGVPTDFKGSKETWKNLLPEEKEAQSKIYKLGKEYNNIIDEMVKREWDKLVEELGAKKEDGKYTTVNAEKLVNLIKEEAENRKLADNLIESVKLGPVDTEGNIGLEYQLDTLVNRPRIETLLMSLVNSRVVKQTMPGDAMIQLANTGFESTGSRKIGESNFLKSYREGPDGNTLPAQTKVPLTAQYNDLAKAYGDINDPETLKKVNAAIKKGEIDTRLLQLVGYRIPTQGMNSIDYLEIVEFLPPSSANAIVLPTEIVAKSGGDFDIDKLNIFRPNFKAEAGDKTEVEYINTQIKKSNDLSGTNFEEVTEDIIDNIKDKKRPDAYSQFVLSASKGYERYLKKGSFVNYKDYSERAYNSKVYEVRKQFRDKLDTISNQISENRKEIDKHFTLLAESRENKSLTIEELAYYKREMEITLAFYNSEVTEKLGLIEIDSSRYDSMLSTMFDNDIDSVYEQEKNQILDEALEAKREADTLRAKIKQVTEGLIALKKSTTHLDRRASAKKLKNEIEIDNTQLLMERDSIISEMNELISTIDKNEFILSNNINDATKKELQNRLIEISKEIISHPSNFELLVTPNSTRDLDEAINDIKEALGLPTDTTSISIGNTLENTTIMEQFRFYMGGKQGVGISAIHNTFHTLFQQADTHLNKKTSDLINFEANRDPNTTKISLGGQKDVAGRWISDVISQFINLYVDVAKDPKYKYLNAGLEAANIYFFLIHMGVDVKTISYFITQPSVAKLLTYESLNISEFGQAQDINKPKWQVFDDVTDLYWSRLKKLYVQKKAEVQKENPTAKTHELLELSPELKKLTKYNVDKKKKLEKVVNQNVFGTKDNDLLKGYLTKRDSPINEETDIDFLETQLQFLYDFKRLREQSDSFTEWTRTLNFDTARLKNIGAIEIKRRAITEQNVNELFHESDQEMTARQKILENTIVGSFERALNADKLYEPLFKTTQSQKLKNVRTYLFNELDPRGENAQNKLYSQINNDFIAYITQRFYGEKVKSKEGVHERRLYKDIDRLMIGPNSMAKRLLKVKKLVGGKNVLLKQLQAMINAKEDNISNISIYARRLTTYESNSITDAYNELYDYQGKGIKEVQEFVKDLTKFGIIQSGLANSPITYVGLIPYEKYGDIVKSAIENYEEIAESTPQLYEDFIVRFGGKNVTDSSIVPFQKRRGNTNSKLFNQKGVTIKGEKPGEWVRTGEFEVSVRGASKEKKGKVVYERIKFKDRYGFEPRRRSYKQQDFHLDLNDSWLTLPNGFDPNIDSYTELPKSPTPSDNSNVTSKNHINIGFEGSNVIAEVTEIREWEIEGTKRKEIIVKALGNQKEYRISLVDDDMTIFAVKKGEAYTEILPHPVIDLNHLLGVEVAEEVINEQPTNNESMKEQPIESNEYEVAKKIADARPKSNNIPQNLVSGISAYGSLQEARPEIKAVLGENPHSIDMIENGFRTRTTRTKEEVQKYGISKGTHYIWQFGKSANGTTKQILTKVTAVYPKSDSRFKDNWNKEGWTEEGFADLKKFKEPFAIEFEVVKETPKSNYPKVEQTSKTVEEFKQDIDALVKEAMEQLRDANMTQDNFIVGFHGGQQFDKPSRDKQYSGEFRDPEVRRIAESMGARYDGQMLFYTQEEGDVSYEQAARMSARYAITYGNDNPTVYAFLIPKYVADFTDRGIAEVGVTYDDIENNKIREIGRAGFERKSNNSDGNELMKGRIKNEIC